MFHKYIITNADKNQYLSYYFELNKVCDKKMSFNDQTPYL